MFCVRTSYLKSVKTQDPFSRTLNTARKTLEILRRGLEKKELSIDERDVAWLDILEGQIEEIPEDEEEFIAEMKEEIPESKYNFSEYINEED